MIVIFNLIIIRLFLFVTNLNISDLVEVLPKDDGEFYQFVYVSNGKQIRGASVPFQFKLDECSEFSDDEDKDAVVVK